MEVFKCYPNESKNIFDFVESILQEYNPDEGTEVAQVAVVADEPLFKKIFEMWFDSYVFKTSLCFKQRLVLKT